MKRRLYQIVMAACQLGVVICMMVLSGELNPGGVLGGIFFAAIFTSSIIILLDLPGGIIRWSVAALYAVVFLTACYFFRGDDAASPRAFAGAIFMGLYGCVVVAIGIVTVKWMVGLPGKISRRISWNSSADGKVSNVERSDRVTRLKLNELTPQSDKRREPIFGPGAPNALVYIIGQVVLALLFAWFYSPPH